MPYLGGEWVKSGDLCVRFNNTDRGGLAANLRGRVGDAVFSIVETLRSLTALPTYVTY
jgi:hypothetical protein